MGAVTSRSVWQCCDRTLRKLGWAILGGGPWPMHPDWVRKVRDDCREAGVPFWFKQWGEFLPVFDAGRRTYNHEVLTFGDQDYIRLGKRSAGRLLDRREWGRMPEVKA